MLTDKKAFSTIEVEISLEKFEAFIAWQSKLHPIISKAPGFISLNFVKRFVHPRSWHITERFDTEEHLIQWKDSSENRVMMDELAKIADKITERGSLEDLDSPATEIFVTEVHPEKVQAYKEWIGKIHQVEAKFPGFKNLHVQSPANGKHWITILQFDSENHLEDWLNSKPRKELLAQTNDIIASLEDHRIISPFGAWFKDTKTPPPLWQQTMIILLVLFPIVMLELRYLNPQLATLPGPIGTFLSNALSVTLVSWPMMPFAIRHLSWWLYPKDKFTLIKGTAFVLFLYLLEVLFFLLT